MFFKKINFWYLSSFFVTLIVAIPISTVLINSFSSSNEYLILLTNTYLFDYVFNSFTLLVGVLILTFLFGVLSAYFISFYDFPGVKFFNWALILSFAVPPYIYAY